MADPANIRIEGMFLAFVQSKWLNQGLGIAQLEALKG